MKPVPGIMRVTVKKSKNILFVIAKPDVFKSPASEQFKEPVMTNKPEMAKVTKPVIEEIGGEDGEVDETGVEPKDVELVMSQAGVPRAKAVKVLKINEGDIV